MVETRRDGFTLIELLITIMLISILAGIAQRAYQRLAIGAEIAAVAAECRNLYTMFEIYNVTTGSYPYASSSPAFELDTFNPLPYDGGLQPHLQGGKADAYDSPDDSGTNQEFWLTMTMARNPTIRFVVASSDNAPLAGGEWLEGVYIYQNGELSQRFGLGQ